VEETWRSANRQLAQLKQEKVKGEFDLSPKYAKTENNFLINAGKIGLS
jgi:hypothetical protein